MISTSTPVAPAGVRRAIAKHSFCVLSTSRGDRPHAVGVLYAAVGDHLYVATSSTSRKARNLRENPQAAVCIPVRRYPFSPPLLVQFGGTVDILAASDPHIAELVQGGRLKRITSHGELDDPEHCFLRIDPDDKVSTYGIGVPLRTLLRDPLHASRTFRLR